MEPTERTWGITPVPDRLRTLSLLDVGLLWGNLGVSLLVLVAGTLLAGLGLREALLAILVGAVLGNALLGSRGPDRLRAPRSPGWCCSAHRSGGRGRTCRRG